MSTTLPSTDEPGREARPDDERTTWERYCEYREANPELLDLLYRKAVEYRDRFGRRKIGIGFLTEVVRWDVMISTGDPEYKINNTYAAYLVRDLIQRDPSLAEMFELRKSHADVHFGYVRIADWPGCDQPVDGGLW